jgi:hypothetical protein
MGSTTKTENSKAVKFAQAEEGSDDEFTDEDPKKKLVTNENGSTDSLKFKNSQDLLMKENSKSFDTSNDY